MNPLEKISNQIHQRAGLLAVITGVFQTCECEATVRSMASTLKHVFSEYPVGDFMEKATLMSIDDALNSNKESLEDHMKEMMDKINEILKDSSN